ncbi:MAG TPA: acylphosphatase [Anaerolineales bacterium]
MDQKPRPDDRRARAHVWVYGRVQGVGFRAHVEYGVRQIGGLTGWVRNVGYDMVEAVAEGEREKVERFIEMMKEGPRGSRVDESKVEWEEPIGEFDRFSMRRSLYG